MDARTCAVAVLRQVLDQGRSLGAVLPAALADLPAGPERPLAQELCYGVLRWLPRLEAIARLLLRRPPKERDADLLRLILIGLYQLIYLRIPPHAAVSETVRGAARIEKPWAKGVVNAVLRRFVRERAAILAAVDAADEAAYAHPAWWLARIKAAWPCDWRSIAQANNERPPFTLRVNLRRGDRAGYLSDLAAAGIAARAAPHCPAGVTLEEACDLGGVPGFRSGRVSVQDGAAQLAAPLLDLRAGQRVLDACAAPGGKTAHILEHQPELAELVAVEQDAQRLALLGDNLRRLGLHCTALAGDAADPQGWWSGQRFDRILLDAPCSASGVIRRHPDIKYLRRETDIGALAAGQRRLLDALWPLLKSGGMLVYATCSILPEENSAVVRGFLAAHPDAAERTIDAAWGRALESGRQILPGEDRMDGFYYACLHKRGGE